MVTAPRPLRLVFFGTPAFAVPTIERLASSSHELVAAIMQPDRPQGRGHHIVEGAVKQFARAHDIPTLQPERIKAPEFLDALAALEADLGIVAAYGKLLPEALLRIPRMGLINVHASLLPRYRGAAPVHRAVMAGETETGVTIMRVVLALDAGPMIASVRRPIDPDETSDTVERDLAALGASLLAETVDRLARGDVQEIPQDDSQSTYAPRLTRADSPIDWTRPALAIHNQVRGLHPWPLASTSLRGRRVIVRRTSRTADAAAVPPGTIIEAAGERLVVATGEGALQIHELQLEGKRALPARDFLAGHGLRPGTAFEPPPARV
jgi:methionyl-tRNA formyltransferase